ncbi:hypothetical protein [Brevibacillus porteri]|nr:hypothetical protein [Brevibacillus porteri]MED1803007.1 hypothetical protein [Brevibacillus porteri]MED2135115.1 hypothetical protein [Brevibacillus porteri]MED2745757.1 hypothetical protein [Brevibacillus porteri]MED2813779.1 hypothetical protein [Brevibacillus porteri]MED2897787.1 hypothetical protein [Brevibacillus porteri]
MDKTNKKKQGVLMIVGGALAIVGAGYGLLTDEQAKAIQPRRSSRLLSYY